MEAGILGGVFWEEFDGYRAGEALILRPVNDAHSSGADLVYDAEVGDDFVSHITIDGCSKRA